MPETIKTVYIDDDLLAFYKPGGLPTVPLKKETEGDTLLSIAAKEYPEILSPFGRNPWEGTILHRLDTPTSGLVLAARNEGAFLSMLRLQERDLIEKTYIAKTSPSFSLLPGFEPFPFDYSERILIQSSFRSFGVKGASVRPVFKKRKGDERIYSTLAEKMEEGVFKCTITRGFRHQIRCHLSWMGNPILGDVRYGGEERASLSLEAVAISFPSLRGKGRTRIESL